MTDVQPGEPMTVKHRIMDAVADLSMPTERELAEHLFGHDTGYQQRVNSSCRFLVKYGYLERHGRGGTADPFRYEITSKLFA